MKESFQEEAELVGVRWMGREVVVRRVDRLLVDTVFAPEKLTYCRPSFGRDVGDGEVLVDWHVDATRLVFRIPVTSISASCLSLLSKAILCNNEMQLYTYHVPISSGSIPNLSQIP